MSVASWLLGEEQSQRRLVTETVGMFYNLRVFPIRRQLLCERETFERDAWAAVRSRDALLLQLVATHERESIVRAEMLEQFCFERELLLEPQFVVLEELTRGYLEALERHESSFIVHYRAEEQLLKLRQHWHAGDPDILEDHHAVRAVDVNSATSPHTARLSKHGDKISRLTSSPVITPTRQSSDADDAYDAFFMPSVAPCDRRGWRPSSASVYRSDPRSRDGEGYQATPPTGSAKRHPRPSTALIYGGVSPRRKLLDEEHQLHTPRPVVVGRALRRPSPSSSPFVLINHFIPRPQDHCTSPYFTSHYVSSLHTPVPPSQQQQSRSGCTSNASSRPQTAARQRTSSSMAAPLPTPHSAEHDRQNLLLLLNTTAHGDRNNSIARTKELLKRMPLEEVCNIVPLIRVRRGDVTTAAIGNVRNAESGKRRRHLVGGSEYEAAVGGTLIPLEWIAAARNSATDNDRGALLPEEMQALLHRLLVMPPHAAQFVATHLHETKSPSLAAGGTAGRFAAGGDAAGGTSGEKVFQSPSTIHQMLLHEYPFLSALHAIDDLLDTRIDFLDPLNDDVFASYAATWRSQQRGVGSTSQLLQQLERAMCDRCKALARQYVKTFLLDEFPFLPAEVDGVPVELLRLRGDAEFNSAASAVAGMQLKQRRVAMTAVLETQQRLKQFLEKRSRAVQERTIRTYYSFVVVARPAQASSQWDDDAAALFRKHFSLAASPAWTLSLWTNPVCATLFETLMPTNPIHIDSRWKLMDVALAAAQARRMAMLQRLGLPSCVLGWSTATLEVYLWIELGLDTSVSDDDGSRLRLAWHGRTGDGREFILNTLRKHQHTLLRDWCGFLFVAPQANLRSGATAELMSQATLEVLHDTASLAREGWVDLSQKVATYLCVDFLGDAGFSGALHNWLDLQRDPACDQASANLASLERRIRLRAVALMEAWDADGRDAAVMQRRRLEDATQRWQQRADAAVHELSWLKRREYLLVEEHVVRCLLITTARLTRVSDVAVWHHECSNQMLDFCLRVKEQQFFMSIALLRREEFEGTTVALFYGRLVKAHQQLLRQAASEFSACAVAVADEGPRRQLIAKEEDITRTVILRHISARLQSAIARCALAADEGEERQQVEREAAAALNQLSHTELSCRNALRETENAHRVVSMQRDRRTSLRQQLSSKRDAVQVMPVGSVVAAAARRRSADDLSTPESTVAIEEVSGTSPIDAVTFSRSPPAVGYQRSAVRASFRMRRLSQQSTLAYESLLHESLIQRALIVEEEAVSAGRLFSAAKVLPNAAAPLTSSTSFHLVFGEDASVHLPETAASSAHTSPRRALLPATRDERRRFDAAVGSGAMASKSSPSVRLQGAQRAASQQQKRVTFRR